MPLSIQQKYILEVLRKLREQLQAQVQGKFSEINISAQRMEAMLRQLHCAVGDVRLDASAIWLGSTQPDSRRLEAVDVRLELAEGCPQDFSVRCQSPVLLRFTLEGSTLRLFTVATLSDPLHNGVQASDSPGWIVWISDSGAAPPGLSLPPKQILPPGSRTAHTGFMAHRAMNISKIFSRRTAVCLERRSRSLKSWIRPQARRWLA